MSGNNDLSSIESQKPDELNKLLHSPNKEVCENRNIGGLSFMFRNDFFNFDIGSEYGRKVEMKAHSLDSAKNDKLALF